MIGEEEQKPLHKNSEDLIQLVMKNRVSPYFAHRSVNRFLRHLAERRFPVAQGCWFTGAWETMAMINPTVGEKSGNNGGHESRGMLKCVQIMMLWKEALSFLPVSISQYRPNVKLTTGQSSDRNTASDGWSTDHTTSTYSSSLYSDSRQLIFTNMVPRNVFIRANADNTLLTRSCLMVHP